jgi:hypothetical protein
MAHVARASHPQATRRREGVLLRFVGPRLRVAVLSVLAATALITFHPSAPAVEAAEPDGPTAAAGVIAEAKSHLGARWRRGAEGPRYFDCTGLVLRAFADEGLVGRVGGWKARSGYAMLAYFRRHGLTSRTGRPGDVVIWGGGSHAGIYLGNGLAISTLTEGVRIHGVHAVRARFTTFGRTNLSGTPASAVKTALAAKKAAPKNNPRVRHAVHTLILRAGAGTSAKALGRIARNAPLAIVTSRKDSHDRTWYSIRTAGGRTGWVAGWLTRN